MDQSLCSVKRLLIVFTVVASLSVSGCDVDLHEKLTRWLNKETYSFNGVYSNQHNSNKLIFKDARVLIQKNGDELIVPFSVKDSFLHIRVRHSSREKRPDIVMRIHGGGEVLTCSACAKYQLSNVWVRETF